MKKYNNSADGFQLWVKSSLCGLMVKMVVSMLLVGLHSCGIDHDYRSGFRRVGSSPIEWEIRGDVVYLRNSTNRTVEFSYLATRDPNANYLGPYQKGAGTLILYGGEETRVLPDSRVMTKGGETIYMKIANYRIY